MLSYEIIKMFMPITSEEQCYLDGKKDIDFKLYMEQGGSIINNKKLLNKGQLITLRQHTRFMHFPKHSHDFVELMYVCQGSITHIINGQRIVVNAGELIFLGQNVEHEIEKSEKNDIALNLIILPEFFDSPLAMLKYDESPLRSFIVDSLVSDNIESTYMHFRVSGITEVQNTIENLILTLIGDAPNKYTITSYSMGLVFLHLTNCIDKLTYQSIEDKAVVKVLKYVNENYRDGSLEELSKKLHYSYTWLSREIKRKTGKTYTDIVQERRLSEAAFLLKNTDLKVIDIAVNVGYDNISYFHKIFFKKFCKTPREYRISAVEI